MNKHLLAVILCLACLSQTPARTQLWVQRNSGTTQNLYDVCFVDRQNGWIVGQNGIILHSASRGSFWEVQNSSTIHDLNCVTFSDSLHGWAAGSGIIHTTDGGQTWTAQTDESDVGFNAIVFTDENSGWALGDAGMILHTTNGGAIWSPQNSGTTLPIYGADFVDPQNGWAVSGYRDIEGSELVYYSVVLHTANGGITWTTQRDDPGSTLPYCVDFVDAQYGWVAGRGPVLHTEDGGITWTEQLNWSFTATDLKFVNRQNGWVTGSLWGGSSMILNTSSTGLIYNVQSNQGFSVLYGMDFVDLNHGWAVGLSGTILCYADSSELRGGISAVPRSLFFGVIPCFRDSTLSLTLRNTQELPITILTMTSPPGFTSLFTVPWTIAVGDSVTSSIRFSPSIERLYSDSISISTDMLINPPAIQVAGVGSPAWIEAEPESLTFGSVPRGRTSDRLLTIMNTGPIALTVTEIAMPQGYLSLFTLPLSIPAGGRETDTIRFHPTVIQSYNGTLAITNTVQGSPLLVPLRGSGARTMLSTNPGALTFAHTRVGADTSLMLKIRNEGLDTITVSALQTLSPFISQFPCPFTIAGGDSVTNLMHFHPLALGDYSGIVTISSDAANNAVNIPLHGMSIQSVVAFRPDSLFYGRVLVGSDAVQLLTIRNSGSASLTITSMAVPAGYSALFDLPVTIASGDSMVDSVRFTPLNSLPAVGALSIVSDAINSPTLIPLRGNTVWPSITVGPPSLEFGHTHVNTDSVKLLMILNTGNASLTITDMVAPTDVSVYFELPLEIPPGGGVTDTVIFRPTAEQPYSGSLVITGNALNSPFSVPVHGSGVLPHIAINPPSLSFGDVLIGHDSLQVLTIRSTGTAQLRISEIVVPDGFISLLIPPLVIPNGSQITDTIRFRPQFVQPYLDSLRVISDALPSPSVVPVDGNGVLSTSVATDEPEIPSDFFLAQNYPNPFNPKTTIRFGVPHVAVVTVVVFDALGHEIATVSSGVTQPGIHSVTWNGAECSTGMYFIRMQSDSRTLLRKMLLLK